MMKSEKYQQNKVMIILQDVLIAVDLREQKALDVDLRAIQQIVF